MKLRTGENIKKFRKEKDITQEQFAEMLCVSCQSVSRWESGVCYPDIELLPTIAKILGISVDFLLGVNEITENEDVEKYLDKFQNAISQGKIYECIEIAREGVKEYPNNYVLLDKLMYALFVSGDDDGNIPEWKENMKKYDAEITALGERILKHCPDLNIRLEATSRLAFNHCLQGRKEIGRKIFETLPPMEYSRESQIWWALEEDEKLSFLQKAIHNSYYSLSSYLYLLANSGVVNDDTELQVLIKRIELDKIIFDSNRPKNNWGDANNDFNIAKRYIALGEKENCFKHLKLAVKEAIDFDNRPDEQKFCSLLVGEVFERKTDFETSDTRPLCEILRDKWLIHDEFDSVRDSDEFKEIINMLS